jgi:anaerobic selenocysteine-containing dehydrogenase
MHTPRRTFLVTLAAAGVVYTSAARAQTAVDEKDATAASLGYVAEATRADAKKYPRYAAGQACGNCALYQGKAGDAAGACPLFAGKVVSAKAWCSAYSKKA